MGSNNVDDVPPVDKVVEKDDVVTLREVLSDIENNVDTARSLFGNQRSDTCTYPEGYKPRQALFACLTCVPDGQAGICFGCSVSCHEGHDVEELYTKRKFSCDCGNDLFKDFKCKIYEKSGVNELNQYNHNYSGRFCVCDKEFDETDAMSQCVVCEDWFHLEHLGQDEKEEMWSSDVVPLSLVCKSCAERAPYLAAFPRKLPVASNESDDNVEKTCVADWVKEENESLPLSLDQNFRKMLCACSKCIALYEMSGVEFLLDGEDDLEQYSRKNLESTESLTANADAEMVNELVKVSGSRDAAIHVLQGFNDMKEELTAFVQSKGADAVVTAEDVHYFFHTLTAKRQRLSRPDE